MRVDQQLCDICGTCVAVCPTDAILVREYSVTINQETCVKCGACMAVCPARAISNGEAK